MVYQNKVVAAVKCKGKILREQGNLVTLPFGSEYSIFIKNLNSVRIQVKIWVDGKDAAEGTWIIVGPHDFLELERFIANGNFNRGNRFKFIERTGEIEAHRGIGSDDGLIRIEYKTEQVPVYVPPIFSDRRRRDDFPRWDRRCPSASPIRSLGNFSSQPFTTFTTPSATSGSTMDSNPCVYNTSSCNLNDVVVEQNVEETLTAGAGAPGITVPGSESNQQFYSASNFPTTPGSEVIVLQLRGIVAGQKVERPVTVAAKPKCVTCGKVNQATDKFCAQCGTALVLI